MSRSYYDILGVSSDASQDEIHIAYRRLAKVDHPDNKRTGNREKFEEDTEAYRALTGSDPNAEFDNIAGAWHGGVPTSNPRREFIFRFIALMCGVFVVSYLAIFVPGFLNVIHPSTESVTINYKPVVVTQVIDDSYGSQQVMATPTAPANLYIPPALGQPTVTFAPLPTLTQHNSSVTNKPCVNGWLTKLSIGSTTSVITVPSGRKSRKLRMSPDHGSTALCSASRSIYIMTVLDGPSCSPDGTTWWKIMFSKNGVMCEGWMAESGPDYDNGNGQWAYFLQ